MFPSIVNTPAGLGAIFGIPGATFTYASGPRSGQPFNPAQGSGLATVTVLADYDGVVDNITNDVRASRVWAIGVGNLTTTAGLYNAKQTLDQSRTASTILQSVEGDGSSSLINVAAAGGLFPVSQNGTFLYSIPGTQSSLNRTDVDYSLSAPYGSVNFQSGRFAIGGSIRYDFGSVKGTIQSALPTPGCRDVNRDGVTIPGTAECQTTQFAPDGASPVDYDYGYLSYSTGLNFRLAESASIFAR